MPGTPTPPVNTRHHAIGHSLHRNEKGSTSLSDTYCQYGCDLSRNAEHRLSGAGATLRSATAMRASCCTPGHRHTGHYAVQTMVCTLPRAPAAVRGSRRAWGAPRSVGRAVRGRGLKYVVTPWRRGGSARGRTCAAWRHAMSLHRRSRPRGYVSRSHAFCVLGLTGTGALHAIDRPGLRFRRGGVWLFCA